MENKEKEKINPEMVKRSSEIERIAAIVSDHIGVPVELLKEKTRTTEAKTARHIAIYFSYVTGLYSSTYLGRYFGERVHSIASYSLETIIDDCQQNPLFKSQIFKIAEKIGPEYLEYIKKKVSK